ncbi:MAG TPA: PAS domain S-box protein [Terriglobales bacterium]|nr:PAS domain S-box protein [Terriglobales bacterium]
MSPVFEQILVFLVMSIVLSLFTWIYVRDRQQKIGLWMLGWTAVLLHFAVPLVGVWLPLSAKFARWNNAATLLIAGSCFLLSVTEVYLGRLRWYFAGFVSAVSLVYLTGLLNRWFPSWGYAALLGLSMGFVVVQLCRRFGFRSQYLYLTLSIVLLLTGAAVTHIFEGLPIWGIHGYLSALFGLAGVQYWRNFRRFTPGVILTSMAFIAWGLVFPIGGMLLERHLGPPANSVVYDLPKYFVAFGMILTLFENQAEVATGMARQYQDLFESNLAAVYVSSFDGKLLNCNAAFLKLYGFQSKQEATGAGATSLFSHPHEHDAFLETLHREGQALNYECRHRRRDGTHIWVLERATIIRDSSGVRCIEGTAIDITERKQAELALKQSEERFATIFRQSPTGCAIISIEGVLLSANDNFLRILGLPPEEVLGKTGLDLGLWKSQEQRDDFYEKLQSAGSLRDIEVKFKDAHGNKHEGLYFATLVRIGDKDCIFGMLLDQTDKRELEAKFLQAQKMEALGRLAGGIAHDFNNLLGVIGGYAELLQSRLDQNDACRRYCNRVIETTERAAGLTRQLLTFSRKEITRPMPLRPDQMIRELSGILPRLIGEDVELLIDLRSTSTVMMDKTHFEQIIFNLVINARDAMPNGGKLSIDAEDIFRPVVSSAGNVDVGRQVAIRIHDTGMGMEEDILQHAFEPFYTTKDIGRGTGLGLSTVYGIVRQSGGEISIDSQSGSGTQISIFLPAVAAAEVISGDSPVQELMPGKGNILLVEDELALREANAEFLSSLGYSVTAASSGPEALKLARDAGKIDLVISDVVMPQMNGREFADRLLEFRPGLKMLFVSGYADDVVLQTGLLLGNGLQFLQKPYSLKQLGIKVQEVMASAKAPARAMRSGSQHP